LNITLNVLILSLSFVHYSTCKDVQNSHAVRSSYRFSRREEELLGTAIGINLAISLSSEYEESAFTFEIYELYHFISGYQAESHEEEFDVLRIGRPMLPAGTCDMSGGPTVYVIGALHCSANFSFPWENIFKIIVFQTLKTRDITEKQITSTEAG
jgi:hypothetical protein